VVAEPIPADTPCPNPCRAGQGGNPKQRRTGHGRAVRLAGIVHLSQAGTKGALSTVSLRAGKPNFTLGLVNSVPANDIGHLLGAFDFATLPAEDIASVNILRGPLSSVYGSEAGSRVISIMLRAPAEQGIHGRTGSSHG